ncbi:polysulfide reductase [Embleya scabrispora]|uniref:Polysulfide reductase n=1 Tax=Embleya scabrispora TaxID=159449 RepID=A0A1T3NMG7_9ACTN|nr:NrfD/PsrC family molybdoenzyme membrane anchor subunit [Embleya scabrispora]OPC78037.1 polysulfide reductase [Embleya scabrispora]
MTRGEARMVPKVETTSYYGRPIIKAPVWAATDIAGYVFLGGLAGASSLLAAGAEATGRPALARTGKVAALGGISLSVVALVHDLGRPERFVNMLRVFKPTSPMNMGSWLLAAYGPAAGVAAATDVSGRLPGLGRAATAGAALLGPAVATYTAVLFADTAVPAWHEGYRELPFLFAGSAAGAASGLALLTVPPHQAGPARRTAIGGALLDLLAARRMRARMGVVAETYRTGRAGRLTRAAEALTVTGAVGAALSGVLRGAPTTRRVTAAVAGTALLAGSVCTRFGVFAAGMASAEDPKYTVIPQRERRAARQ